MHVCVCVCVCVCVPVRSYLRPLPSPLTWHLVRYNSYNLKAQEDSLVETYPVGLRRKRLDCVLATTVIAAIIAIVAFAVSTVVLCLHWGYIVVKIQLHTGI